MLSQANINRALTERALAKTAGAAHMSKHAENWFSANNYSNLKDIGIGAGTAALAGGATYAASGLVPGLKKKRLARALMALGAGGAAGGAAGYYGKDIRNFDYGKLNPWRKSIEERALAKTAGAAHMSKHAERMDGPTTRTQYDFAGPATAEEIAAASKGKKTKEDVQAWLDRTKSGKQYPGSGNWFTANNYSNLKDIGIGVGTGALTYGATGLIPGLKKKRLVRALLALSAGGAAGYYGSNIRGQA